ncbi:MAG TPA: NADP-dependent malic enzyme [Patescibacteria group bacterium]|nr:NADP-dependent malic enzyme [Patescibacteria group bacterium]
MDYGEKSVEIRKSQNVIKVVSSVKLKNRDDLSTYYTPGIAAVSQAIADDKTKIFDLTIKRNSVAVISDGSAVLGLGNIGPEAALPVMEGKSLLFSEFGRIDAFPICLATQDTEEIIQTVQRIAPSFGGINLEDISAPRCFEIEERLQDLGIPVMHDDQHGTAVVVLAGLINALKVVKKDFQNLKIVISGAGAAGTAITKIILEYSKNKSQIIVVDRQGAIYLGRPEITAEKAKLAKLTGNTEKGGLAEVIKNADVFIGVSAPKILTGEMVKTMNQDAIVFAMANPVSEIDPVEAKAAGVKVIATGRSDFPNQINNVLAFPGIFRGALDAKAKKITDKMLLAAALALANFIEKPTAEYIIPSPFDRNITGVVAEAVRQAVKE